MAYPVAAKTQAAGVSAAVAGAVLYLAQTYLFKGSVPDGIASMIYIATPGVLAFAAAYLAPHQHRDPAPAPVLPAQVTLTAEQEEAIREVLAPDSGRMEQAAADERKITVAQMVPPSTGSTPP